MENNIMNHPVPVQFFQMLKERYDLTKRELEVLQLLSVTGFSNRELAEQLQISEKTTKNHVSNLIEKLKASSSREVQAIVFRSMLLPQLYIKQKKTVYLHKPLFYRNTEDYTANFISSFPLTPSKR
ncbi:response regulator transcription factor [Paenibacillus sp. 2TAB23]|uniref:response regulator transcription factor n=1 Tax=Paenibacillus sp. 2TAB23 TaxID=3233004 RepID=UPI003F9DBC61